MKTRAFMLIVAILLFLFGCLLVISAAKAEGIDAYDPGFPWGDYTITKVYSDQMSYKLEYNSPPYLGYLHIAVVNADCVTGGVAEKVGTVCTRIGNQKFKCRNQELRWTETLEDKVYLFLPKGYKCPPCPVCESQSTCTVGGNCG